MENENNALNIGELLQYNIKQEANAVMDYNSLLQSVRNSNLPKSKIEKVESEIYEIIGDELNHQERLKMLYTLVTDIKENKN